MSEHKKTIFWGLFLLTGLVNCCCPDQAYGQSKKGGRMQKKAMSNQYKNDSDTFIIKLLAQDSQLLEQVDKKGAELDIRIIYTQVNRDKKGKPVFTDHFYEPNGNGYFYPASTVKLPVAILALQKLNELKIAGLDKNSTMITGSAGGQQTAVSNDPSAADGRPTIAHYIKKILLVSDNDAFNRLYEFLGQEYINKSLHKMGYTDVQIIHRLSINLSDEENRHTNPVRFLDTAGNILYEKPGERSRLQYADRNTRLGNGYMRGNELVKEPFDFSKKNRLPLADLHQIVKSIVFPKAVPKEQRFNLTNEDHDFLLRYMSMRPGESVNPVYDTKEFYDNYVKMIYYGSEVSEPDPAIRIFNKTGTAYGFLIDACYFADLSNNIEFLLSATIYCNSDGIFNDDRYDYKTIGYPFLKNLGRVIYEYELKRKRNHPADLSAFKFNYGN